MTTMKHLLKSGAVSAGDKLVWSRRVLKRVPTKLSSIKMAPSAQAMARATSLLQEQLSTLIKISLWMVGLLGNM